MGLKYHPDPVRVIVEEWAKNLAHAIDDSIVQALEDNLIHGESETETKEKANDSSTIHD